MPRFFYFTFDCTLNPENNAHEILSETHEIPFFGSTLRRTIWDTRQKKKITYTPDMALSNKYFKVIIQYLESTIFTYKVEVLFYKIQKKLNKTSTFSVSILDSRHCMMTLKYLFDRAKSIL